MKRPRSRPETSAKQAMNCSTVAAAEIEVDAGAERVRPDQPLEHPDDLGALLVDRRRVKVADLVIDLWPHIVGERSCVLGELRGPQNPHVGYPLDRGRTHVGREFLVAK